MTCVMGTVRQLNSFYAHKHLHGCCCFILRFFSVLFRVSIKNYLFTDCHGNTKLAISESEFQSLLLWVKQDNRQTKLTIIKVSGKYMVDASIVGVTETFAIYDRQPLIVY